MKNKLKCAVIGVGNMGKNHARIYSELKGVSLVAIADVNEKVGKSIANEYKAVYYSSYKEMILKENPDIISIAVPTAFHYSIAEDCLESRINMILEKPITMNVSDGKKLLALAKKHKAKFLVGHIERHNPAVKKVKEMIDRGELGKVIAVAARRVGGFPPQIKDADISIDLAIHDIDIVNYLLDELPKKIFVNRNKNHIKKRHDSVEFFLKYKNASAYIQANWITPTKIRKLNITGSEGYLEMDYMSQTIDFYKSNYEKFKQNWDDYSDYILKFSNSERLSVPVSKKEPLKEEIRYFIECVKKDIAIDSNFALEALKIALYE